MTLATPCPAPGCRDYLLALAVGEVAAAEKVLAGLLADGWSPQDICLDVLAPALNAVGDLWQRGEIAVAQEHLATAITMSHLSRMADAMHRAVPNGHMVVLAGSPGELHVVGLRMLRAFLEADGYRVLDLGISVPRDDLLAFVRERRPDVVGLTTALSTHLREIGPLVDGLEALPTPPVVMVGGAAYGGDPALARRVGADLYARDAQEACEALAVRLG